LQSRQRGPDEQLERHVGAHRVAGQREDRHPLLADRAEPLRHPRLHRHLPEGHGAQLLQRRLHDVVLAAHADPAGGDQQVGTVKLFFEGGQHACRVVGHAGAPAGERPRLTGGGREHVAVGIPDLAGDQRRARLGQLVARGQHDDPRPGPDLDRPAPRRRGHRDLHRPHPHPGRQQRLAFGGVAARVPNRVPRLDRAVDLHPVGTAVGRFHLHDSVRAVRHPRAGHDLAGGPG